MSGSHLESCLQTPSSLLPDGSCWNTALILLPPGTHPLHGSSSAEAFSTSLDPRLRPLLGRFTSPQVTPFCPLLGFGSSLPPQWVLPDLQGPFSSQWSFLITPDHSAFFPPCTLSTEVLHLLYSNYSSPKLFSFYLTKIQWSLGMCQGLDPPQYQNPQKIMSLV